MWLAALFGVVFFFFNDTATTEIYTLSLHDALPILRRKNATKLPSNSSIVGQKTNRFMREFCGNQPCFSLLSRDRKSTRLNSSHLVISYAVFCLKKKNTPTPYTHYTTTPPPPNPPLY